MAFLPDLNALVKKMKWSRSVHTSQVNTWRVNRKSPIKEYCLDVPPNSHNKY